MKKTSISALSPIIILFVLISACKQTNNNQSDNLSYAVSVDSLMNDWNVAWNKHDSTAISNMLATNSVVVFSTENKFMGSDTIMTNWVNKNLPITTNLKTEKMSSSTSSEMAFFNGSYTLDITENDSVTGADSGCFTFVWKLQNNKDWKIELLFFGKSSE